MCGPPFKAPVAAKRKATTVETVQPNNSVASKEPSLDSIGATTRKQPDQQLVARSLAVKGTLSAPPTGLSVDGQQHKASAAAALVDASRPLHKQFQRLPLEGDDKTKKETEVSVSHDCDVTRGPFLST